MSEKKPTPAPHYGSTMLLQDFACYPDKVAVKMCMECAALVPVEALRVHSEFHVQQASPREPEWIRQLERERTTPPARLG